MSACEIEYHALLPVTQSIAHDLEPYHWLHVAEFVTGLLQRSPLATGKGWEAERLILGCLATELRLMAHEAGEPVPELGKEGMEFGRDPLALAREVARVRES